jgi:hypothetical protein
VTGSWIGWLATAVFATSYACRNPVTLRRVQAAAAVLWLVYGWKIGAPPVIVANLIVAGAALLTASRATTRDRSTPSELTAPGHGSP